MKLRFHMVLVCLIHSLSVCALVLYPSAAAPITIDFDQLPNGDPIGHSTPITNVYAEWGVTLNCYGLYPDSQLVDDNNAYAYEDPHAVSGSNVVGGRIISDAYHWLNFSLCYGVAEFSNPVGHVSINGRGSPFQVYAYDQDGNTTGRFSSPRSISSDGYVLEISQNGISKIEFGSWTGDHYTYFDDLTFAGSQHVPIPVPLPGTVWLLGSGLVGLVGLRKKFKK